MILLQEGQGHCSSFSILFFKIAAISIGCVYVATEAFGRRRQLWRALMLQASFFAFWRFSTLARHAQRACASRECPCERPARALRSFSSFIHRQMFLFLCLSSSSPSLPLCQILSCMMGREASLSLLFSQQWGGSLMMIADISMLKVVQLHYAIFFFSSAACFSFMSSLLYRYDRLQDEGYCRYRRIHTCVC